MSFASDQVLLYDVEPWSKHGFGVANFGDNTHTQNMPWWRLAGEIGKAQLGIMVHVDASREQYISRNTLERIGKLLNRIHTVLLNRATEANALRLEPQHASPAPLVWPIHPAPFFPGNVVKNSWLLEFNLLCMVALTNIFQHSDNNLALEITAEGSSDVWQYFRRIRELVAGELLDLPKATYEVEAFRFTKEHYDLYSAANLPRNEALATPVRTNTGYTEDDLRPLMAGIPATIIKPLLARYPVTASNGSGSIAGDPTEEPPLPGTGGNGPNATQPATTLDPRI